MNERTRIAVVGGGIFGVTAATRLARAGHLVELFERQPDLLAAASGINQYRLHRGYHYPRCLDTAVTSRIAEDGFRNEYAEALVEAHEHHYAIARTGSLVGAAQYRDFLAAAGLEHEIVTPDFLCRDRLQLCIRVRECLVDPARLRALAWERLRRADVTVRLGTEVRLHDLDTFDCVVVATYAWLNHFLEPLGAPASYQFEVCEKPVVRLPPPLRERSIVVLDGPFMCVDPIGTSGLSVMGNVVHAIHATNVGRYPEIPARLRPLLDSGVVRDPPVTRFAEFVASAREFMPAVADAEHVGSMFTVRTVLPGVEDRDSRPTLVQQVSDRVVSVFSGKIGTCVRAADAVVAWVDAWDRRGARARPAPSASPRDAAAVTLRPLSDADAELVVRWRALPEVHAQLFAQQPPSLQSHREWFLRYAGSRDREEFVILLDARPVGTVGLSNIDHAHGRAEYGILIGEPDARRRGVARRASRLILEHAFLSLGLGRVYLSAFADNLAAIRLYERVGFRREGSLRAHVRKAGVLRDVIVMGMLASELPPDNM
jgi:UDP-4-amino-4,6-dideoxy-N-acetyl-beta-L-altrosamine N-acetyltransferase